MIVDDLNNKTTSILTANFIRAVAQDLITFGVLFGLFVWPLINLSVLQPQSQLSQRLEKLESSQEQTRQNLNAIDKNLAVLAESTKRTDEALNAIRAYLTKESK